MANTLMLQGLFVNVERSLNGDHISPFTRKLVKSGMTRHLMTRKHKCLCGVLAQLTLW